MAVELPVHSEHGASKAARFLACPGSIAAERGLEDKPSPHAAEGTAAHALAENCLNSGLDPSDLVGSVIHLTEGGEFKVTEEMVEAVKVYVDYVRGRMGNLGEGAEVFFEHRFDLSPLNPAAPAYGTSDCVIWDPSLEILEVIDYKHGAGVVVEVEENPQLRCYALGAVVELRVRPKVIRTTIVQPRAFHPNGPVRSEAFDFAALIEFKKTLFAGIEASLEPDAPRVVGDHCRFCKAKPTCPAQREMAVVVAQSEFDAVEDPQLPAPEMLSEQQLMFILDRAGIVEDWLKGVREYVHGKLEAGEEFPGYKLVAKRVTRKWTDEEVVDRWLARRKVGMNDRYTRKLVSPAQAEKVLKKMGLELPEKFVVAESSGTNLAPNSDPRPALPSSASLEFEADPELAQ